MKKIILISMMVNSLALTGCAGLLVGGVVAGGAAVVAVAHDRRTAGTVVDDKNLEAVIAKKLLEDNYIDSYSHTNLTIFNGIVLITGEASSRDVETKILNLVGQTPNVKRVESDIKIAPTSSLLSRGRDSVITGKVKTALLSLNLPNFDSSLVNVSTERGSVYIMGIVSRAESNAIVEKARLVSGVESVTKVFEYID